MRDLAKSEAASEAGGDAGGGTNGNPAYYNTAVRLLRNVLPESVIQRMQGDPSGQETVIADSHEHVVMMFAGEGPGGRGGVLGDREMDAGRR